MVYLLINSLKRLAFPTKNKETHDVHKFPWYPIIPVLDYPAELAYLLARTPEIQKIGPGGFGNQIPDWPARNEMEL